jgi:TolB protein
VDVALGQVNALDVLSNWSEEVGMELWYRLLNCGFRLAASAGTDSFTNLTDHYNPGGGRVYARVEGPMSAENWVESYKRGRSFVTNGPMLSFTVEGREAGGEIKLPDGAQNKVRVQAAVRSQVPVDKVEILVNGQPVARIADWSKPFSREIPLKQSSWIAVRALGPAHRLAMNDAHVFAHTSPVYVTIGEKPISSPEDARFYIDWIDKLIARVEEQGRFATSERKADVIRLFRSAQEIYRKTDLPVK